MTHYWSNPFHSVMFSVAGFPVHWYGLAYLVAFLTAQPLMRAAIRKWQLPVDIARMDEFCVYLILGVMLGGRLGEALFYNHYWLHPVRFFEIWKGGMSSHGGIAGVTIATWLFARKSRQMCWPSGMLSASLRRSGCSWGVSEIS
jgi:phosphatidylglycerol:prolipoprotein diacylglycerol transferase